MSQEESHSIKRLFGGFGLLPLVLRCNSNKSRKRGYYLLLRKCLELGISRGNSVNNLGNLRMNFGIDI